MTILFNGTFKPTDRLTAPNTFSSGGVYETDSSAPQMDSITILPAPRRDGKIAAKFYNGVGSRYDSRSAQHNFIRYRLRNVPTTIKDVWYGFSIMFDQWSPSGAWGIAGISVVNAGYNNKPADWGNNRGLNLQPQETANNIELLNNKNWFAIPALNGFRTNLWYDVLFHIVYGSGTAGSLEMLLRKEGETEYTSVFRKTGYATHFSEFNNYPEDNYYVFSVGMYRSSDAKTNQSCYICDPKAGTTRADVEYKTTTQPPAPTLVSHAYNVTGVGVITSTDDKNGEVKMTASTTLQYIKGSNIQIKATPGAGWSFKGWIYDDDRVITATSPSYSATVDRDLRIEAVFEEVQNEPPQQQNTAAIIAAAALAYTLLKDVFKENR